VADENNGCLGWAITVTAVVEAALVLLWIGGFAAVEPTSDPHFYSDVVLPLIFLAIPALAAIAGIYLIRRNGVTRSWLLPLVLWTLLGINLAMFIANLVYAGGGV